MNQVTIMGNLVRDPEVRFTQSGLAICNATIAVNKKRKDKEDKVAFIDVTIWDKRGEAFAKFHKKGDQALVSGELEMDSWEDKNGGGKRTKLKVVAHSWEFVKRDAAANY